MEGTIQLIAEGLILLFLVYDRFLKPGTNLEQELAVMKQACQLKHEVLDENIVMIKENHLAHIEETMRKQSEDIVRIFTILEERLPKK